MADKVLPKSFEELIELTQKNTKIKGFGLKTTTILPCPFCAAPDWMRFPVTAGMNDYADQAKPIKCSNCERTAQLLFVGLPGGGISTEIVQVDGSDPPDWFPKMRRI